MGSAAVYAKATAAAVAAVVLRARVRRSKHLRALGFCENDDGLQGQRGV